MAKKCMRRRSIVCSVHFPFFNVRRFGWCFWCRQCYSSPADTSPNNPFRVESSSNFCTPIRPATPGVPREINAAVDEAELALVAKQQWGWQWQRANLLWNHEDPHFCSRDRFRCSPRRLWQLHRWRTVNWPHRLQEQGASRTLWSTWKAPFLQWIGVATTSPFVTANCNTPHNESLYVTTSFYQKEGKHWNDILLNMNYDVSSTSI